MNHNYPESYPGAHDIRCQCGNCAPWLVKPANPYTGISLSTISICATILNDRIESAMNMLRLNRKHPGVLPESVAIRYARDYFRANVDLRALHDELEARICSLVNL